MLKGDYATAMGDNFGMFLLKRKGKSIIVLVSDGSEWPLEGQPWEHVSVSLSDRTPTWEEMCWVKNLFWKEDEWVIQCHPPALENVNVHQTCLHLWRPVSGEFPRPPKVCV